MDDRKPGRFGIFTALLALLLLLVLAAANAGLAMEPLRRFFGGEADFRQAAREISDAFLSDDFRPKEEAVTLNGLFAQAAGRRVYRSVVRLSDGSLTSLNTDAVQPRAEVRRTAAFSDFLAKQGIPLLCVIAPYKVPLDAGDLLPAGLEDASNIQRDAFLRGLEERGVAALDLRPLFSAAPEQSARNFYRTDHHWTPAAARAASEEILKRLESLLGTSLDRSLADPACWESHELPDWWIGSSGKRVGPLFAGTDPLLWLTPRFQTLQSFSFSRTNREYGFRKGDYASVCLYLDEYTAGRDLYHLSGDAVYMDKLYPLGIHRNLNAPNPKRILLIGDSFCRSVQTFLAVEFAEVHMLDPRYYEASSLAQYAAWTRPDAVVILSQTLSGSFFVDSGAEAQESWQNAHPARETLLSGAAVSAAAGSPESQKVPKEIEKGQVYHLSFHQVSCDGPLPECVSAVLVEQPSGEVAGALVFDTDYGNAAQSFSWSFAVPDGARDAEEKAYGLLLVPGLPETRNAPAASAVFSGVTLERESAVSPSP